MIFQNPSSQRFEDLRNLTYDTKNEIIGGWE